MRVYRNLSIMTKVLLLTTVMVVLQMTIFYMGYMTSEKIETSANLIYKDYAKPAMRILDAKYIAGEIRRCVTRMLDYEAEGRKSIADRIKSDRATLSELFESYDKRIVSSEGRVIFDKIIKSRAIAAAKQDEVIATAMAGDEDAIKNMYRRVNIQGDITLSQNEYIGNLDDLARLLVKFADEESEEGANNAKADQLEALVVSVAALVIGLVLSVLIARTITGPVKKTGQNIMQFAQGDLCGQFDTDGKDEIAVMGQCLQGMANNLTQIIGSVKEASGDINDTAQDFSSLAEETNASVEEFKANVDNMSVNLEALASTGEQVNTSVQEVASGAQATAERGTDIARKVEEAMSAGESGMASVQKAVEGIDGVAGNVSEAAKSVQELGERTRQIQSFVTQIGSIADQTNLLALNAAIEAARAGDAGRGFAVVAEEVRKLAEDSNSAAKNIQELAKTITADLDHVVRISLDNAQASEEAKELSRETEDIIKNMLSFLKDIAGATQDLAAISQEQAASSEEIAESVESITAKVRNTAEAGEFIRSGIGDVAVAAERMATGANDLTSLADTLQGELNFFKINNVSARNTKKNGRLALRARG
ncbi:MAG: methyl-accepting chemotaxis protein [Synergistaceae bacterium]|jgi:methyl-accepting chemotaxis protein|nr:methyl-accepting chemotaxis protein [Synergistaceae bacterium]